MTQTLSGPLAAPAAHMPPRVLICTADVGCGHGRAANAVTMAMRTAQPGIQVRQVDVLETTPRWFNRVYRDLYLSIATRLPKLNGHFYRRTDVFGIPAHRGITSAIEARALAQLCDDHRLHDADLIVCTHFLCARVLSRMREHGRLPQRLAVVVTDQHPHAVWRVPHADLFFVASDEAAAEMRRNGIDGAKIRVSGIPIDARFGDPLPQALARQRHHIPADARVVLVTGGGLGLGGIDQALDGILDASSDAYAVVVCGRNESLFRELTARTAAISHRCKVVGLTQRMHELMAAADVMVGKPGGLTTSEAIATGLPMVLLRPLPGQEEHNADAMTGAKVAVLQPDPFTAGQTAARIVRDDAQLSQMRSATHAIRRPAASATVAEAALGLVSPERLPGEFGASQRRPAASIRHDMAIPRR